MQILLIIFLYIIHNTKSNTNNLVHQYCNYLQSTPEPDILIYNRVPKCGSKTLVELLKKYHRHGLHDVTVFSTGSKYWSPIKYDYNKEYLQILINNSIRIQNISNTSKLLLAGHWNWHNFQGDFGNKRVEHINVLRRCSNRVKSQLFFDLYDQKKAKMAKRTGSLEEFQTTILGSNGSVHSCLDDINCVRRLISSRLNTQDGITHAMIYYLCGDICAIENNGDVLRGAVQHLNPIDELGRHVEGAVAVGISEDLAGTIRLFACAYPTYFKGILNMLEGSRRWHKPSATSVELREHHNLKIVEDECGKVGDNHLYDVAVEHMKAKLNRIRQDRRSCCRRSE